MCIRMYNTHTHTHSLTQTSPPCVMFSVYTPNKLSINHPKLSNSLSLMHINLLNLASLYTFALQLLLLLDCARRLHKPSRSSLTPPPPYQWPQARSSSCDSSLSPLSTIPLAKQISFSKLQNVITCFNVDMYICRHMHAHITHACTHTHTHLHTHTHHTHHMLTHAHT